MAASAAAASLTKRWGGCGRRGRREDVVKACWKVCCCLHSGWKLFGREEVEDAVTSCLGCGYRVVEARVGSVKAAGRCCGR